MSGSDEAKSNIVFAHSMSAMGGAERVTLAVIDAISHQFNTTLLSPSGEIQRFAEKKNTHLETLIFFQCTFRHPLKSLAHILSTVRLLKKLSPLLIHTGDILALRSLTPACRLLKIPIVCHVHFPYDTSFINWTFSDKSPVASFIYCSQELSDNLRPKIEQRVPDAKHHVVHNGVYTDTFAPGMANSNVLPRIGIIGNLQKRKGHEEFLHMANILKSRGLIARYDIIGGDILQEPRQPFLEKEAERLGVAECTTFHGQVDDVRSLLKQLDIVVCASHEEAFPVTILEAMAAGKAIVTTNVNGIPEAIDDNCGILVEPFDAKALANGVAFLLHNEKDKLRLEKNASVRVNQHFSMDAFQEKVLRVYTESLL